MVLPKLSGSITQGLEQFGDGDVLRLQADIGAGHTDLGQAGAVGALPGDEGRPAGGAALLAVGIGEFYAFVGDAINIGGAVAHQAVAVAAQVGDADVIAPDDEDIWFFLAAHFTFSFF